MINYDYKNMPSPDTKWRAFRRNMKKAISDFFYTNIAAFCMLIIYLFICYGCLYAFDKPACEYKNKEQFPDKSHNHGYNHTGKLQQEHVEFKGIGKCYSTAQGKYL